MPDNEIGHRLCELRLAKGVSQDVVSEACGISRVALSRYENGERKPRLEIASKLAEYYGVTINYLLAKDEKNESVHPIDPHTYYAEKFGPETQRIVDELLAKLQAMPEDRREDAAKGALTFVRGLESEEKGKK